MGFNKLWLPEVETLKESLMELGNEDFSKYWKNRYFKADAVIGSSASDNFIKQFINMEYNEHTAANKKATKQG